MLVQLSKKVSTLEREWSFMHTVWYVVASSDKYNLALYNND